MSAITFHAMYAIRGGRFRCGKCRHEADLPGAVKHAVENQLDMSRWVDKPLGPRS